MALTKKMLIAMDIPAEKIDEIMSNHLASVEALREERDSFKEKADKLSEVEKKLSDAEQEIKAAKSDEWEKKYTALKTEYDGYRSDVESKAVKTAKETAFKKLLVEAGISEKRIGSVLRVSDVDGIKLNEDGTIQDADKISESVKKEWADFIVAESVKGAEVPKPPQNKGDGVDTPSRAAQLVEQYRNNHYGVKKED